MEDDIFGLDALVRSPLPPPPPTTTFPQLPPPDNEPVFQFSPDVEHRLIRDFSYNPTTVKNLAREYVCKLPTIQGAPALHELVADDAPMIDMVPTYSENLDKTWARLQERANMEAQAEADAVNPYLPRWTVKADGKESPWVSDMAGLSDPSQMSLTMLCREATPRNATGWAKTLEHAPCPDKGFMSDIVEGITGLQSLFIWDMGSGTDPDWRWSAMLPLMAGLGLRNLQAVLKAVDGEPDVEHWANCSSSELAEDVLKAHLKSGYPVGWLRCDWSDIQAKLKDTAISGTSRPLKALLALHILKHTRITQAQEDGQYNITAVYHGSHNIYPVAAENCQVSLKSTCNAQLRKDLCVTLQINQDPESWEGQLASSIFRIMTPGHICQTRSVSNLLDIVAAPSVQPFSVKEKKDEYHWVRPGIGIRNLAQCDLSTKPCRVNKNYRLTGTDVIRYDWRFGQLETGRLETWRYLLPDIVEAKPASEILHKYVKNINCLGHTEGWDTMINTVMSMDFARKMIDGTALAGVVAREFPALFVMPMGHAESTTTNQGKTSLGRILLSAMVPGQTEAHLMNMSNSAPTQRSIAVPIRRHGTTLLDEFQIPPSSEHFLHAGGLQSLMTGSSSDPGSAGQNSSGMWLKHPLVFSCKVLTGAPDILNRSCPTFMDTLTDETRSTDELLNDIGSGAAGTHVRLSHLLWMKENNIIDLIKTLKQRNSKWRFGGHASLTNALGNLSEVETYLEAAIKQITNQRVEAERSGLIEQVGGVARFDAMRYFKSCSNITLGQMEMLSNRDCLGRYSAEDALRALVEDNGKRKYLDVVNKSKVPEWQASTMFANELAKGAWEITGWKMEYFAGKEGSKGVHSDTKPYVVVTKMPIITDDSPTT